MPPDYRRTGRATGENLRRRRARRVTWGWLGLALIAACVVAIAIFFRGVLLPFVVAVLVAYVLEPPVRWLARVHVPRPLAVVIAYAVFFTGITLFFQQLVPRLEQEGRKLLNQFEYMLTEAPSYYKRFEHAVESLLGIAMTDDEAGKDGARHGGFEHWGLGPDMGQPNNAAKHPDVPALATQSFGPDNPADDSAIRFSGARPDSRPQDEVDLDLNRSNMIVRRIEDGIYGIRFNESSYEFQRSGEGRYNLIVSPGAHSQSRVADLKNEILTTVRVQLEHLSARLLAGFFELVQGLVSGLMSAAVALLLTLLVAAYLLMEVDRFQKWLASRVPRQAVEPVQELLGRIDKGLRGVVRGQLLVCVVNGFLSFVGFLLFIPEYAVVFGVLAGLLSFIPIFGTIISAVPAVCIGLTQSPTTGLWVLLWIFGVHFIEANLIEPRIFGKAARISPVIVLFALIAGQTTFGLAGALLAVPTMALLQALLSFAYGRAATTVDRRLGRP